MRLSLLTKFLVELLIISRLQALQSSSPHVFFNTTLEISLLIFANYCQEYEALSSPPLKLCMLPSIVCIVIVLVALTMKTFLCKSFGTRALAQEKKKNKIKILRSKDDGWALHGNLSIPQKSNEHTIQS
jgi:hypothetical protein